jgi:outer membrane protein OmpA-like peptidoglycan-associated protein
MKIFQKTAAVAAIALSLSAAAFAQSPSVDELYPHNFVTVQGGAQATFTNYKFTDLITPQFAVSVGRYFTPQFGVRLHAQGYEAKGGFDNLANNPAYKFKSITGNLDLLLNMSNIIFPHRTKHNWDWVLLAGFGINHSWDFGEYEDIIGAGYKGNIAAYNNRLYYDKRRGTYNGRLGTQLQYNLGRSFALSLEADANCKNDMFNLKVNECVDWQVAAFLGITYKFGMKKKAAPEPAPVVQEVVEEAVAPVAPVKPAVVEEKKPETKPVVKEEPLNETFYYEIRLTDPQPQDLLEKISAWCKKYPGKTITISGYADKGTGNARVNARYAAQRADKVAKWLQKNGIAADRMTVESFGDKVQPFSENDRNRCVIVVGK